jgi:hypothetical protein
MALHVYRRHRTDCTAGRPNEFRSSELDERRRGWGARCECQIQVSGTLGGKFSRKSTGTADWAEAKRVAAAYEEAGSWSGQPVVAPSAPEPAPERPLVAVAAAFETFITNREAAGLTAATLRKYRTFAKQVGDFAASRGYVMLDQFTPEDIDRFRGELEARSPSQGQAPDDAACVLSLLRQPEVDRRVAGQLRHQGAGRLEPRREQGAVHGRRTAADHRRLRSGQGRMDVTGSEGFEAHVLGYHGVRLREPVSQRYAPLDHYLGWHRTQVFRGPGRGRP